jgi:hypothetical protein
MKLDLNYNIINTKYSYYNILLLILLVLFFYYFFFHPRTIIEGFTWSDNLIQRFLKFQATVNDNNHQYNIKVVQDQASPEETEHLLKTGYWPWSNETKYLYMDAVYHNPIIKIEPHVALDYAMKTYNESAAKQLIFWNTNEGKFLLHGAISKHIDRNIPSENIDNSYNIIKCDYTNKKFLEPVMKKFTYYSNNGYSLPSENIIENENIPKELPGFKFTNKVCNPCNVFNEPPDYSCAFKINLNEENRLILTSD